MIAMPSTAERQPSAVNTSESLFQLEQLDRTFNHHSYRLFIATPKQANNGNLLYLLDGNAHFTAALQAVDPELPLPTIVAIGYPIEQAYAVTERTRDYTFAADGEEFANGGKAADFLDFIAELPQQLQQQYALHPQHTLFFGHSFGGLFGLYALLNKPHLFDDYTLASPSLWWGNGTILQQRKADVEQLKTASILFTLSEYEANPQADPAQDAARIQRITKRHNILNVQALRQQLAQQGVISDFKLIPKTNHGGSAVVALKLALQKAQQTKK
ncbi:hypothetical protein A1D23_10435 [Chelonobacter oris]|uniref:alpha/beta hydrolase n=1 Tax=Chelonobacter oris TaxID=505317 RepID=UPI00244CF738|nr:alpha/beta hydrolase-fold protein [Chelonobacter oris]MDH3000873.1 hypothetical protein [Chelonobacter oris]